MLTILAVFTSPCASQIVLSEIMYHAPQLESYEEFMELYNTSGTDSAKLSGWLLGDQLEQDSLIDAGYGLTLAPYAFALVLDPGYGGHSTIYDSLIGPDVLILTINDNAFGAYGLRNDPPDTVILINNSGGQEASFCYPSGNPSGYSCEKIRLDGGDDPSNWAVSPTYLGTPGSPSQFPPPIIPPVGSSLSFSPDPFDPDRHDALMISLNVPDGIASAAVMVYDLRGRRLKVIFDATVPPGVRDGVLWNGRDRNDRRLPPGLYILFAEFRDASGNRKSIARKTLVIAGRL